MKSRPQHATRRWISCFQGHCLMQAFQRPCLLNYYSYKYTHCATWNAMDALEKLVLIVAREGWECCRYVVRGRCLRESGPDTADHIVTGSAPTDSMLAFRALSPNEGVSRHKPTRELYRIALGKTAPFQRERATTAEESVSIHAVPSNLQRWLSTTASGEQTSATLWRKHLPGREQCDIELPIVHIIL